MSPDTGLQVSPDWVPVVVLKDALVQRQPINVVLLRQPCLDLSQSAKTLTALLSPAQLNRRPPSGLSLYSLLSFTVFITTTTTTTTTTTL